MKKYILFIGLFFATTNAFAQEMEAKTSHFSIGPSFGFGHTWISPYNNWEFQPTWSAGLTAIYGPIEWFGFGGDVRYSVEGSKTIMKEGGATRVTRLEYIRVPLKAMVFFGGYEDDFRPKLTLGPSFGFLVAEDDTYNARANGVDVGLNASAGFNYRMARAIWLNVDVNYYQGLTDVRMNSGTRELNGNLGLNLGVAFGI